MDKNVIERIVKTDSNEQARRVLSERRDEILGAIEAGSVQATPELMSELYDLNIALGDADMFKDCDQ